MARKKRTHRHVTVGRRRKKPRWTPPTWKSMLKTRREYVSKTYPDITKRMKKAGQIRTQSAVAARAREWTASNFVRVGKTGRWRDLRTGKFTSKEKVLCARRNKRYREKKKAIAELLDCDVSELPEIRKRDPEAFDSAIERYMYGSK